MAEQLHNPKLDEHPGSNTEKDPGDWVSGGDPMTAAQASYLATLSEEAAVELPTGNLTKADASRHATGSSIYKYSPQAAFAER